MLFSVSDPLRPTLPPSLLFLSFPLFFFTPHSPQWGSPLHAEQQVGLLLSFCPASSPEPRLACLHSSALIWRSQGPLPPPPPFSLVWSANTLTSSAEKESSANFFGTLSQFDPNYYLLIESHVRPCVSALPPVRFGFCLSWDRPLCLPGGSGKGKSSFFFFFAWRQMRGHWRGERHR